MSTTSIKNPEPFFLCTTLVITPVVAQILSPLVVKKALETYPSPSKSITLTPTVTPVVAPVPPKEKNRLDQELEKCPSFAKTRELQDDLIKIVSEISRSDFPKLVLPGQDIQSKEEEQLVITETCKNFGIKGKEDLNDAFFFFEKRRVSSELFGVASIALPGSLTLPPDDDDNNDYLKENLLKDIGNTIKACQRKHKTFVTAIDLYTRFMYKSQYVGHAMTLFVTQTSTGLRIELFDPWGASALNSKVRPDFHNLSTLIKQWAEKSGHEFVSLPEYDIRMQFPGDKWQGEGLCFLMTALYLQLNVCEGLSPSEIKALMIKLGSSEREKLALQFGRLVSAGKSERESVKKQFKAIVEQLKTTYLSTKIS